MLLKRPKLFRSGYEGGVGRADVQVLAAAKHYRQNCITLSQLPSSGEGSSQSEAALATASQSHELMIRYDLA